MVSARPAFPAPQIHNRPAQQIPRICVSRFRRYRASPVCPDSPRRRAARRRRQRMTSPRDVGDGVAVGARRPASSGPMVGLEARHQAGPKACACGPGRGSPGSRGRLDPAKVRRCGVRAIGSAGRTTDHAGRRPGPASRWRLGSQSPLPCFITYFLKRLVDFFQ